MPAGKPSKGSPPQGGLAAVGVAALAVACCASLPLLVALAGSVAIGTVLGVGAGVVAGLLLVALVVARVRRRRGLRAARAGSTPQDNGASRGLSRERRRERCIVPDRHHVMLLAVGACANPAHRYMLVLVGRGVGSRERRCPTTAGYASVTAEQIGEATILVNIVNRVGGAIGAAGLVIALAQTGGSRVPTSGRSPRWP